MAPESDPDLARLAKSFNEMADAVQTRFEREARFASDVSHELRSPITALTAAVEVLDAGAPTCRTERQQALDVVVGQVRRFDQMVMDLLELSRIDAGSTELHPGAGRRRGARVAHRPALRVRRDADRDRSEGVRRRCGSTSCDSSEFSPTSWRTPVSTPADRPGSRSNHTAVTASTLSVDDVGPGVARGERARIFERFARGSAARHRVGTGLGLGARRRACPCPRRRSVGRGSPRWRRPLQGQLRGGRSDAQASASTHLRAARWRCSSPAAFPTVGRSAAIQDKDLRQLGDTIPTTSTSTIPPTTIVPTTTTTLVDTATTIATEDVDACTSSAVDQLKGYPRAAGEAGRRRTQVLDGAAGGSADR